MKTTLTPPLRLPFEMAAMERVYTERLIDLFGSEAKALQAHDEWQKNHPPIHHWTTYNAIAMMEATKDLLPSERKLMIARVEF